MKTVNYLIVCALSCAGVIGGCFAKDLPQVTVSANKPKMLNEVTVTASKPKNMLNELTVTAPKTHDGGTLKELTVTAPKTRDGGTLKEVVVTAPQTRDGGTLKEVVVTAPQTRDGGTLNEVTVSAKKPQYITYDDYVDWDEEAWVFAFYKAERLNRSHDNNALGNFMDGYEKLIKKRNNREQCIKDITALYKSVFPKIAANQMDSEIQKFISVLISKQNEIADTNLVLKK